MRSGQVPVHFGVGGLQAYSVPQRRLPSATRRLANALHMPTPIRNGPISANSQALKQEISQSVNRRMDSMAEKVWKQLAQLTDIQQNQGHAISAVQAEQRKERGD